MGVGPPSLAEGMDAMSFGSVSRINTFALRGMVVCCVRMRRAPGATGARTVIVARGSPPASTYVNDTLVLPLPYTLTTGLKTLPRMTPPWPNVVEEVGSAAPTPGRPQASGTPASGHVLGEGLGEGLLLC